MNDEYTEKLDSLTAGESDLDNDGLDFEIPDDEQSTDDSAQRIAKAEEIAKNQRLRAEKAEREAKALREAQGKGGKTTNEDLGFREAVAFAKADISDEDIETVITLAKAMGLNPVEGLQNDDIKAVLRTREEKRKTAAAMNAGHNKSAPVGKTAEVVKASINAGKTPKPQDVDAYLANRYSNKS